VHHDYCFPGTFGYWKITLLRLEIILYLLESGISLLLFEPDAVCAIFLLCLLDLEARSDQNADTTSPTSGQLWVRNPLDDPDFLTYHDMRALRDGHAGIGFGW